MNIANVGKSTSIFDTTKKFLGSKVSQAYAEHRPHYSDELFQVISDYCRETVQDLNLAVDVGCGPGNSTLGLTKHFKKVIGVDVSETQIKCAPKDQHGCQFKVGYSHELPFIKSGSVDLFSSGQSFHYMQQDETFSEADRVLRPGGSIAIFGYSEPKSDITEVNEIIREAWNKMVPYWSKESVLALNRYRSVKIPYSDSKRNEDLRVKAKMTLSSFIGLVQSTSVMDAILENEPNFVTTLEERLSRALKENDGYSDGDQFEIYYEIFLLLGHKPIH